MLHRHKLLPHHSAMPIILSSGFPAMMSFDSMWCNYLYVPVLIALRLAVTAGWDKCFEVGSEQSTKQYWWWSALKADMETFIFIFYILLFYAFFYHISHLFVLGSVANKYHLNWMISNVALHWVGIIQNISNDFIVGSGKSLHFEWNPMAQDDNYSEFFFFFWLMNRMYVVKVNLKKILHSCSVIMVAACR